MDGSPDIPIGERVRFYRQARHKKQTVVAGLAGITEDYLSQIERGLKTPTISLLHRLARILGVPTSALLGEPSYEENSGTRPAGAAIQQALTRHGVEGGDLAGLRQRVDDAWTSWQISPTRFTEAIAVLPALIIEVDGAARAHRTREAHQLAADLYFLLRTYTKRIGRVDLALLVADRARRAAEDADDPIRIAAATWNLGQVLLSTNEPEAAEDVAVAAAEQLPDDAAPVRGALWLVAAVAAVRRGDLWTARDRLREYAWPDARRAGECNVLWTVFGPLNTEIHAVSIEMEAGETAEALRLADRIDASTCPSMERRATFALELARCYDQRRDDNGVLLNLLSAEQIAPEDMQHNLLARELVRGLMKRARPSLAPQVHGLAERINLVG